MTLHNLLFDSSPLLDYIISLEHASGWVKVYVYDKLSLEMTVEDYFKAEFDGEMIEELLKTAMRAGQESVSHFENRRCINDI